MLGVSLRSLLSHKLRLALTTIAVILGVSFVAGTFILTDTINATFTGIFNTANAGVAVTVHGRPIAGDTGGIGGGQNHPVPTSLLATVRAVPGVKDAVGSLFREGATLIGSNGKPIGGNGPPTFGANWITDSAISPYHLRSGTAPVQPNDVVVDAGTAAKNGLVVGQSLAIVFAGGVEQHFTISGIAGYGSSDNLAGATIALFTEATAEQVLDGQGKYDSILVSANTGVTDVVLRERTRKGAAELRGRRDRAGRGGGRGTEHGVDHQHLHRHTAPGVRLHLAVCRLVSDHQHLQHPGGAAHP